MNITIRSNDTHVDSATVIMNMIKRIFSTATAGHPFPISRGATSGNVLQVQVASNADDVYNDCVSHFCSRCHIGSLRLRPQEDNMFFNKMFLNSSTKCLSPSIMYIADLTSLLKFLAIEPTEFWTSRSKLVDYSSLQGPQSLSFFGLQGCQNFICMWKRFLWNCSF